MSLYNMVFGMNPDSDKLLAILGKTAGDFGRFRNVYVSDGYIVVHTRCGGGNRDDYEDVFDEMAEHPWFSHESDCDFDYTYADFFFKLPSEDQLLVALQDINHGSKPGDQWDDLLRSLEQLKEANKP